MARSDAAWTCARSWMLLTFLCAPLLVGPAGGGVEATGPPVLSAGDYWYYRVTRSDLPVTGELNISVRQVLGSGFLLDVLRRPSGGPTAFVWKLGVDLSVEEQSWSGETLSYRPALREVPFPLAIGASSTQAINVTSVPAAGNATYTGFNHSSTVVRKEIVKTREGSFDAFVIERVDSPADSTFVLWYATNIGGLARKEYWSGGVLVEAWDLASHRFAAGPAVPTVGGGGFLGPVAGGIAVGSMTLFVMAIAFLWRHGRLTGKRRGAGAGRTGSSGKEKAVGQTEETGSAKGGSGSEGTASKSDDTKPPASTPRPERPRAAPPSRRRTPEELESEYVGQLERLRGVLKKADPGKVGTKQAKLLLSRALMAAKQERHQEAIELLTSAEERLD